MKMTIASTNPAVPTWPTIGASHAKLENPVTCSEVTTTGCETVPSENGGQFRLDSILADQSHHAPPFFAPVVRPFCR
jgi:hypothetical protein